MTVLNQQEKFIVIFLLCTAIVGAIIGIFRHNWIKNPEILLSPQNLPEIKVKLNENKLIAEHNKMITNRDEVNKINDSRYDNSSTGNILISNEDSSNIISQNVDLNKTKSNKKNVTKNTSGLININIASKEDFMTLPYIGEVKAERIIQLRNEMGVFTSIKDLEKVKGIGPKTLTKIEPYITI